MGRHKKIDLSQVPEAFRNELQELENQKEEVIQKLKTIDARIDNLKESLGL
jgi:predicted nuclease with TOPRIM domain